jgi:hypothetical protein
MSPHPTGRVVQLVGDTGPGWEYYLDMLVAQRNGNPLPSFNDYCPAQRDYFIEQVSKK